MEPSRCRRINPADSGSRLIEGTTRVPKRAHASRYLASQTAGSLRSVASGELHRPSLLVDSRHAQPGVRAASSIHCASPVAAPHRWWSRLRSGSDRYCRAVAASRSLNRPDWRASLRPADTTVPNDNPTCECPSPAGRDTQVRLPDRSGALRFSHGQERYCRGSEASGASSVLMLDASAELARANLTPDGP